MSLVGTYCDSKTILTISSADNSNGKLAGTLKTLEFGQTGDFEVDGSYHFIDGQRSQTIMFVRATYQNADLGLSIFLSLAFFARSGTPDELRKHGSSTISLRTGQDPEQGVLDLRSLKRSAC